MPFESCGGLRGGHALEVAAEVRLWRPGRGTVETREGKQATKKQEKEIGAERQVCGGQYTVLEMFLYVFVANYLRQRRVPHKVAFERNCL